MKNRIIKFRAWNEQAKEMITDFWIEAEDGECFSKYSSEAHPEWILMQFTGLKDKNGNGQEVYESDIIDEKGNIIGNEYETPTLLKDTTNLLIQGFGTKAWETTNKKALERGLAYSE